MYINLIDKFSVWNTESCLGAGGRRVRLNLFFSVACVTIALITVIMLIIFRSDNYTYTRTHARTHTSRAVKCSHIFNRTEFVQKSKSLNGEETVLYDQYFKGICGGSYVELGAHDGIGQDNTFAFHKVLGWSGLLIEASPARFKELQ